MTEKIVFTMAKLAGLKPFKTGRRTVYDEKVPGLTICVTSTGSKSYYLYGRFGGRPRRIRIGGFPDLSVDLAREQAAKLVGSMADGFDPSEAKRKHRGELTLKGLWDLYLEFHAEAKKKASSVAEDKRLWKRYLQTWENRKLSAVADVDVRKLHSRIGKDHGKYAANRALSLLSKMFSVAKEHGELKFNPCEGVKKFAEKSRDRFLLGDELPRFLAALDAAENQNAADAFRLMLWTGARKSNVLGMRWADIDLSAAIWRIPDTKQGEPQRVPLTPEAIKVLKAREAESEKSPFVFPSKEAGSISGHMENVTMHWQAVRNAARMPDLRCHDLRRTMGSWQAAGGASLQVIGGSLGHKNAATTEIYARLQLDPIRKSMEAATAAMMAAGKTKANE